MTKNQDVQKSHYDNVAFVFRLFSRFHRFQVFTYFSFSSEGILAKLSLTYNHLQVIKYITASSASLNFGAQFVHVNVGYRKAAPLSTTNKMVFGEIFYLPFPPLINAFFVYLEFFQTNEKEGYQRSWISFSHS